MSFDRRGPGQSVGAIGASTPPVGAGKRTLTGRLPQRLFLRHIAPGDEKLIQSTAEYRSYVSPGLVWKAAADEAHRACELILADLRAGHIIDWDRRARHYLDTARRELGRPPPSEPTQPPPALHGEACAIDPGLDEPQVCELEDVEPPPRESKPDDPLVTQHDPGVDGNLRQIVEDARRLAERLGREGNKHAARVHQLADAISSGFISVSIAGGVFIVAVLYAGGKVAVIWEPTAEGLEFERRRARVERAAAQLEADLNELDKIAADTGAVDWVDENASMPDDARLYQDGAEGARSNLQTGLSQAPSLDGVRFDGFDGTDLIDRKTSIKFHDKVRLQARRQSEALTRHGMTAVWEVPDQEQARRAERLFEELGITNIRARIVP